MAANLWKFCNAGNQLLNQKGQRGFRTLTVPSGFLKDELIHFINFPHDGCLISLVYGDVSKLEYSQIKRFELSASVVKSQLQQKHEVEKEERCCK